MPSSFARSLWVLSALIAPSLWAALQPYSIPRESRRVYVTQGFFEGGDPTVRGNLNGIRFAAHEREGFERWVIDFSNATHQKNDGRYPQFQLRYATASAVSPTNAGEATSPRFVILFRGLQKNDVKTAKLKKLVRKSRFVRDIIVYPPIEDGDTAIEFTLRHDVRFDAYQPKEGSGRLVMDLLSR